MGIFNKILGGLGFKQEEKNKNYQVSEYEKPQKAVPINKQPIENQTLENNSKSVSMKNLVCYAPKTNDDVKKLIDSIKKGEACIVNLAELNDNDKICVLDYLGGAVYALEANLSRLQGDLYVISPNGMNITTM